MAFIKTWLTLFGLGAILATLLASANDNFSLNVFFQIIFRSGFWVYTLVFAMFLAMPLFKTIKAFFEKQEAKKRTVQYNLEQQKQEEKDEQKRLDRKRNELQIEFEHLQKIMGFQANLDQGKLDKLADMQKSLKSNKQADLDTLRQQIERMKQEK